MLLQGGNLRYVFRFVDWQKKDLSDIINQNTMDATDWWELERLMKGSFNKHSPSSENPSLQLWYQLPCHRRHQAYQTVSVIQYSYSFKLYQMWNFGSIFQSNRHIFNLLLLLFWQCMQKKKLLLSHISSLGCSAWSVAVFSIFICNQ